MGLDGPGTTLIDVTLTAHNIHQPGPDYTVGLAANNSALGKLATHNVLKTTHLTKTAPIFAFSLPCNSVLSNCAYISFFLPCNSVFWLDEKFCNLSLT